MCEMCVSANKELETFLTELEEKYPGTQLEDGTPVERDHHVFVALIATYQKRIMSQLQKAVGLGGTSPLLLTKEIHE